MIVTEMNVNFHRSPWRTRPRLLLLCAALFLDAGCSRNLSERQSDTPRLTAGVKLRDVTFHSTSLDRDMPYRVILPVNLAPDKELPAVYLLHGGGADYREWTNDSDVARFAEDGFILVMPEGDSSYYVDAASRPHDRFEDYIISDLVMDVEHRFPVSSKRSKRAIAGVSMGGFGAITLALRHPDLFAFAGGISPAIDAPSRPFSMRRIEQWRRFRAIFGSWEGQTQRENDPFLLVRKADPADAPYLFITCGEQEGLLAPNRQFAEELRQLHFQFEFHTMRGDHNWNQWNAWIPDLFQRISRHINAMNQ
jgi:putative tributyrin esterase